MNFQRRHISNSDQRLQRSSNRVKSPVDFILLSHSAIYYRHGRCSRRRRTNSQTHRNTSTLESCLFLSNKTSRGTRILHLSRCFSASQPVSQSDLTSPVQICPPQVQRPSTCVLQTGDEETPHLQAPCITLLLRTPTGASVAVAPVTRHTILDRGLMTATVI